MATGSSADRQRQQLLDRRSTYTAYALALISHATTLLPLPLPSSCVLCSNANTSYALRQSQYFATWVGNPDVEGFCRAAIDNCGVTNTTPAEMAKVSQ